MPIVIYLNCCFWLKFSYLIKSNTGHIRRETYLTWIIPNISTFFITRRKIKSFHWKQRNMRRSFLRVEGGSIFCKKKATWIWLVSPMSGRKEYTIRWHISSTSFFSPADHELSSCVRIHLEESSPLVWSLSTFWYFLNLFYLTVLFRKYYSCIVFFIYSGQHKRNA